MLSRHPGAQPQDLELEVLETSAVEDFVQVSQLMALCERIGLRFALDDFGSGYSSLTYLKRLPAHLLKIDQGFIRDMLEDPDDIAILDALLALARSFGRNCIAEGVESIQHGEMLRVWDASGARVMPSGIRCRRMNSSNGYTPGRYPYPGRDSNLTVAPRCPCRSHTDHRSGFPDDRLSVR